MGTELDDLIAEEPDPHVRAALRRAVAVVEGDKVPDPGSALKPLLKLGKALARGAAPSPLVLIDSVEAIVGLLKWGAARRQARRDRSRRAGTGAGLAAYQAQKATEKLMRARRSRR